MLKRAIIWVIRKLVHSAVSAVAWTAKLVGACLIVGATAMLMLELSQERVKIVEKLDNLPKYGTMPKNQSLAPIVKLADEKGKFFCSAFIIDANYAMTAAHCLDDESGHLRKKEIQIQSADGKILLKAKAAAMNRSMDVGLVMGDFSNFKVLPVDFVEPEALIVNAPSMACGFPFGARIMTCSPFIPNGVQGFHISGIGQLVPGMSGGPVVNLATKNVIGINSAAGSGAVLVATPIGALAAFGIEPPVK